MKTFRCYCGNTLHFENSRCQACGRTLGYLPEERRLVALEPAAEGNWRALPGERLYRQCLNYSDYDVCNWMVPLEDGQALCASCRLNHIIPNLGYTENITLWYRIEQAKRRLLYTLDDLGLPVVSRNEDPQQGLAFEFLRDDATQDEFSNELTVRHRVITGHSSGLITINLIEAEHSARLAIRKQMNENYRTLLGHFRHESGHYYWERLINGTDNIDSFREFFGDERFDYQQALKNYYDLGPLADWQDNWISAYASVHPWEDWAESWAHYLHIVDTLETAHDFGFSIHGFDISNPKADVPEPGERRSFSYDVPTSFNELFDDWGRLSVALNALNRSMGMDDAYPFAISNAALYKLQYIHRIVKEAGQ